MIGTVRQGEWDRSLATLKHLVAAQQVISVLITENTEHSSFNLVEEKAMHEAGSLHVVKVHPRMPITNLSDLLCFSATRSSCDQ